MTGHATKNVAIIGGGISGLSAAYFLQRCAGNAMRVTLIERSPRLGGKICSVSDNGFLIEGGPDSFVTHKKEALTLCHDLGLDADLIGASHANRTTYVASEGELHAMPEGLMALSPSMVFPLLRSRLLSWPGKLRMAVEILQRRVLSSEDESLASFINRRLGSEFLDKLAAPLIAGIFSAAPEKLSMKASLPTFLDMEKKHGSLSRGIFAGRRTTTTRSPARLGSGVTTPMMTLRGGLQQLIEALTKTLEPSQVLLNRDIATIARQAGRYRIQLRHEDSFFADEIIFATPANVTSGLIANIDGDLSRRLGAIRHVSTATVSLGFRRADIRHDLRGSGFIVRQSERHKINACSWSSSKFSHRAPGDAVLMRAFVGGDRAQSLAELNEDELVSLAQEELRSIMGVAATPIASKVFRWIKANPQYDVGHLDRIAEIERRIAFHPGLHLAGAAYGGAGIPGCIASARNVVSAIRHQGIA